jgi:predicted nucleic acid-binding protein
MDVRVIERAWSLEDRYSFSWWDALIVASGLVGRCAYLLSEDFQDGQVIDGMRIISPFTHEPESVLG